MRPPYNVFTQTSDTRDGVFRGVVDGWTQNAVVAAQTNVELVRAVGRWRAIRAGSITGILATTTEARTAGTLTVTVYVNSGLADAAGSTASLAAVVGADNTSRSRSTQAKDTSTFAAGDEVYLVLTTDVSWLPITAGVRAAIEVAT